MKPKVTVGQKLFRLNVGNNARFRPQVLTPVVVTKVGRKYFTTKNEERWLETEYRLEDWIENNEYNSNSVLYASKQEYEDEKKIGRICNMIAETFQYGRNRKNLSVETLRAIAA